MIDPLLTGGNMNNCPVKLTLKCEPCTLTDSEKRLYNATINSWNEMLRQQRFEAYMAMEKEAQLVSSSCRSHDRVAYSSERQTALELRASDKQDNDLHNGEVSGTAAHFAREMELRARRAAIEKCRQDKERDREGERSDCKLRACGQE